jgi:hypothetical protein
VFDLPGLPFVEPAFASIVPDASAEVPGVLWTLTERDMTRLDGFESGRYARQPVEVVAGGVTRTAYAYVNRRPGRERPPSRRYLELLAAGATEHGLPSEHIAWLRAHASGDLTVLRPLSWLGVKLMHLARGGS